MQRILSLLINYLTALSLNPNGSPTVPITLRAGQDHDKPWAKKLPFGRQHSIQLSGYLS